jgi:hypothetical protein
VAPAAAATSLFSTVFSNTQNIGTDNLCSPRHMMP